MRAHATLFALLILIARPAAAADGSTSAPAADSTLDLALRRELALLDAEARALAEQRERAQAEHEKNAGALRAEIARLAADVVAGGAAQASLEAEVAAAEAVQPAGGGVDIDGAWARARTALREAGVDAPGGSAARVTGLRPAIAALRARAQPRRVQSGFFDVDGDFVDGTMLLVGPLGVASSSSTAGPLLPISAEGARQLASSGADEAALVRAAIGDASHRSLPLWFGSAADDVAANPVSTTAERLARLGTPAWLTLGAAAAFVVGALLRVLLLARATRLTAALLRRVPILVEARELAAASALCRAAGGAAGRLFDDAVRAAAHADTHADTGLDAIVAAAFVREATRLDRGGALVLTGIGALFAVVVGLVARGVFGVLQAAERVAPDAHALAAGLADATWILLPVSVVVVVMVVCAGAAALLAASLKSALEQGSLQIVDAALRARR